MAVTRLETNQDLPFELLNNDPAYCDYISRMLKASNISDLFFIEFKNEYGYEPALGDIIQAIDFDLVQENFNTQDNHFDFVLYSIKFNLLVFINKIDEIYYSYGLTTNEELKWK